ncbi:acyltransferase family protein [Anaeromicrobium sediminis]|uniref:acyltransferase family protein n=1 Tax=Anaeromicrobium sediminis TaxID=1478221 RepID=UPI001A9A4CA5|nr:acyltransferase family protein [Anaeromicrobium sediminis]
MTDGRLFMDVLTNDYDKYIEREYKDRKKTFDFVRGLAVFFMITVHVLMVYSTNSVQNSLFGEVIDFLGGPPAAPTFMFLMGVFYILSSKSNSLEAGIKKGVKLLLLGYLLSFLRYDLLILLEGTFTQIDFFSANNLVTLWEVDILLFAGWAYILMSLIRFSFKKPIWWLIIAIGVMIVSPFLWGISSNVKIVDWILNYLWGAGEDVYFPIFGWLCYPLIGMIFGVFMKASSDIEILFKSLFKLGLALLLVGSIITATDFNFHIGDYYRSGPGSMIWMIGFVFTWLWLNNKVIKNIRENRLFNIIYYWGKETTSIYFIHWILIMWATIIFGYETQGYMGTILLMALILLETYFLSKIYGCIKLCN